jgi:hypothetical protein
VSILPRARLNAKMRGRTDLAHEEPRMLKIGDVVVTMSHPGPFTVVEISGDTLTIVTAQGLRKVVRSANVRLLGKAEPPAP